MLVHACLCFETAGFASVRSGCAVRSPDGVHGAAAVSIVGMTAHLDRQGKSRLEMLLGVTPMGLTFTEKTGRGQTGLQCPPGSGLPAALCSSSAPRDHAALVIGR